MKSSTTWFRAAVPAGWMDIFITTVKVAIVSFVVLQLKEWFDAGAFDTLGTAADAGLIAGGTLLVDSILLLAKPR